METDAETRKLEEYREEFISSGVATEGNSYYVMGKKEGMVPESIPSVYAVEVNYTLRRKILGESEVKGTVSRKDLESFTLEIYSLETEEKLKTIDVKAILDEKYPDIQMAQIYATPQIYQNEPCLRFYMEKRPDTLADGDIDTLQLMFINVETEEIYMEDYSWKEFRDYRSSYDFSVDWKLMVLSDQRDYNLFEINGVRVSVSSMEYFEDTCQLYMPITSLPEENERLYTMFPDLKETVETLTGLGWEEDDDVPYLSIYLTDNPSPEELLRLCIPDGQEISFEGMGISGRYSKDGQEHEVHSFEEYYEYRKPFETKTNFYEVTPVLERK